MRLAGSGSYAPRLVFTNMKLIFKHSLSAVVLLGCAIAASGQDPTHGNPRQTQDEKDLHAKQQKALVKEDYQKNLEDSRAMVRLSESLRDEIEKNEQYIVSMSVVKKAEEIEKLSKRIRSRMKRY